MVVLGANSRAVEAVTAVSVTASAGKFLCTGNKRRRGGRRAARANDGRRGPCRTSVAVRQSQATVAAMAGIIHLEHRMAAPPSVVIADPQPSSKVDKITSSAQGAAFVSVAVVDKHGDGGYDRDACCDDQDARAATAAATLLRRLTCTGASVSLDDAVAQWCSESEKAAKARLLSVQGKRHHVTGSASLDFSVSALSSDRDVFASRNSEGDLSKQRRQVTFDVSAATVHEITPYQEVYGLHPREFVFGRNFCIMPAAGLYGFVDVAAAAAQANGLLSNGDEELSSDDTDSDSDFDWDDSETVADVVACHGPSSSVQESFCVAMKAR
eukprot:TRINITY_DN52172_c0_g1_i1.p1 TRINITY_DN52172_c0_g1~~TRINITY_DN52172_c0_g1_i1.p1  ORF type:complete len:326 (+),score=68.31 TRINITY_DN52172_c0_g1_i1:148-1125(+)